MTGATDLLPMLADCERALGNPAGAVALAGEAGAGRLSRDERIELAIVVSGARRDLGQAAAALQALALPELTAPAADGPVLRLWYAYAEALLAADRHVEAVQWFTTVANADEDEDTDAAERVTALSAERAGEPAGGQPSR